MLDACPGDVDSRKIIHQTWKVSGCISNLGCNLLNFLGFSFIVNSKSDTKCGNSRELIRCLPLGSGGFLNTVFAGFCLREVVNLFTVFAGSPRGFSRFRSISVKTKLLNDGDDDLVVSAPLGCGKTTLATQLCHDEEIKEKFAYIFFCVVLSVLPLGPLYRLYSITTVTKHQKDSEAVDGLRKLIAEVKEDGPILLCWMMCG
ncbi:hypothetical protein Bca101_038529 [Brassica carinata]